MEVESDVRNNTAQQIELGRMEIELAHHEMPGLMSVLEEYNGKLPLKGAKISGSLHMTIQTAVLIETLHKLGATVRWCSCNIYSTQDHAAVAVVANKWASVFAWKGMTQQEYWQCTEKALTFPDGSGPDLIVDDGSDASLLIHEGVAAELAKEKTGTLPNPDAAQNEEMRSLLVVLIESLKKDSKKWSRIASSCKGVSEETTTGIRRLAQMFKNGTLLFPAINVNDCVTKSKFDNIYGCRHSLPDGIMRATDVMIGGKKVLVCGYGDVGKGCASAMKGCGARVFVTEIDPICALQALMDGYAVVKLEDVVSEIDIFITATGNFHVIDLPHMQKMKHNAIVGNIGHFDNEINMASLVDPKNHIVEKEVKGHELSTHTFPDGKSILVLAKGRLLNLGCATGHPSFVMSCSFTNQVLAQLMLWQEKVALGVHILPKQLDEKVAALHIGKLGANLTKLSETQSKYLNIPVEGPYKEHTYRY
eukprot:GHVP01031582.1.p1 GENE.GHVP01031582.1~~GHVP01031582.1.p1  ORF type:complete len:498 (+),score=96.62 GHVP01031582.1:65-1495(+)